MSEYIGKTLSASGSLEISSELGKGGEGFVYAVASHSVDGLPPASELVAKIYHDPTEANRAAKVVAMLKMPPESTSVAWPQAVIAKDGAFVGYLMQKLDSKNYRSWAELSNTKDRRGTSSDFDVQYALAASRNLAVAIHLIHEAGHRVGDVNESNIFIGTDSGVFIVDTDSAQIKNSNGKIFRCEVGKPEYTSAEISRGKLRDHERTVETDTFAYAVAIFQMLTGGSHPTDGVFTNKNDDPPSITEKIREGILPGLDPKNAPGYKPAARIPTNAIPSHVREIMVKSLQPDPNHRATLEDFISTLDDVLTNLVQCSQIKAHWYDLRDGACGWCEHASKGNLDPWSPHSPKPKSAGIPQTKLPSVAFNDGSQAPVKAKRAAPNVSNNGNNPSGQGGMPQNYPQGSPQSPNSQGYPQAGGNQGAQQQQGFGNQGYNPNDPYNQNFQQFPNNYPNQPQQQPEPKIKKSRRGKILLDYADGTRRERPALSRLVAQGDMRTAIYCLKEETPKILQAWWSPSRKVAIIWGLIIGFIASLAISTSWFYTIPTLADKFININISFISEELLNTIIYYFAMVSSATAILGCLYLMFSGMYDMFTAKRQYGSLKNLKREKAWVTALRFIPISIFYGPFFLVMLIIVSIMGLISFIIYVGRNTR